MSAPAGPHPLARAFRRFQQAATDLETRQARLRAEVGRLERRLSDSHRQLEAVIDAIDTGVAVVAADGRIVRSNPSFERWGLGRPGERLTDALLPGEPGEPSVRAGTTRLRHGGPDGERELACTLIPVGDADGTRVLTVQDITEIRRQDEDADRSRRLEALGLMASEIAHEVRNPLGSIRLFAGMLRDDLDERGPQREMADQVLAAASGLEATVANLLAFAAPPRGGRRWADLAALASDACDLLSPACALRGVRLEGPGRDASCRARVDAEGFRQILLNLLGNALAATEAGGTIRVDARADRSRAVLVVEDTGRGIRPEDLPRVFDPFFSRKEGGTGLGLSIVHRIVESHGGRVRLDSVPGRGTRCRVEIPAPARTDPDTEERHA